MTNHAAIDQDALYYLYVNNEWTGPYQIAQIREQVAQGTIQADDTYAYAASLQRHYTVEELLAASPAAPERSADVASSSNQNTSAMFDDILEIAPQSSAAFDNVLPDLKALYAAYLGITEHTAEPQQALKSLHAAHQGLIQELDHRRSDGNALSRIINEIDEVGDYLANRQQLTQLWQLLSELEKVDLKAKPEDGVNSARAVLAILVGQAENKVSGASGENGAASSSVLLDLAGLEDEADSVITRKILLSARSEVANTKRDMDVLQQTYNELQDQHAKDLEKARKLLEKAEAARAEERHTARQTAAEVRNLAAEIQRLACEPDIAGGSDKDLAEQVARLGEELKTADASTLAYIAEDVLIRMVNELRQLASTSGGDAGPLRTELSRARDSLTQAQAQVAQLTSERDTLRLQYEQSRLTAEKASERAKDREHRLRSTVTALEVTKELHVEVMEDLKSQLQNAQGRVEQMERDLASVRGEMKDSTGTVEARGKAIQHEMQRMVEMKAMLEVRSNELSENLKSAEDELAKAQSSQTDTGLAEALAAKVTQLRTTYEATMHRLREQETNAERLSLDLDASRREAEELRGRGDQLSSELGEARGSLSAAKHRLDELHQAYARLEAERQSLHTELHHRKSTDTIHKQSGAEQHQTENISRLEHESALLQRQLTAERRQAEQLAEARQGLENRITELMAERDELRRKYDGLQIERDNDHVRHTSAIAVSTQAAIGSERRLRELQNHVAELEARLAAARKGTEGETLEPTTARIANHNNALESVEQESLRAELQQVARERDQVMAELETIRTTTTSRTNAVPEHVAKRMSELDRDLTLTKSEITALDERHSQAVAERDRLRREADRLKGELESAAMEHRTALKSARDRLVESQERVAELERKLTGQASSERDGQALRGQLDQSLAEQVRMSQEVQRLVAELARLNTTVPADRDQQIIGLAKASQQLAAEQEKVLVLSRGLTETLQQANAARGRTLELQEALDQRTSERDRVQQELDRQRAELTNQRLGVGTGRLPFGELQPTLEKRDKVIAELEEVRQELSETRARLNESTRVIKTLESLGGEKNRIKSLEAELEKLRSGSEQRQQMFNEARARLVQVSSERERLAAELAEIKSRPDQSVELKMLRRRLIRAKRMIKRMRRERDEARDERMKSATNLHQLTGQLERMKGAQRAAAEALGFNSADSGFSTQQLGVDLQPLVHDHASQTRSSARYHGMPGGTSSIRATGMFGTDSAPDSPALIATNSLQPIRSMTRRLLADSPRGNGPAFTSAFGKPAIPGLATAEQNAPPSQTRLIPAGDAAVHKKRPWRPAMPHVRGRMLLLAAGAVVIVGIWSVPPLVPYSMNGVVNASLVRVKAPIEGQFGEMKYQLHDQIEVNQDLVVIRNDRADTSEMDGLRARLNNAKSSLAQSEREWEEHRASEQSLTTQVAEYQRNLITQLQRQLEIEQRNMDSLRDTLVTGGSDGALKALNVQRQIVDDLSRRIERLQGGQLADDEKPLFYQRLQEVRQQLAVLKVSKEGHIATITETEEKLVDAEAQLAMRRQAVIRSPIAGALWQRPSGGNPWVKQGDDVLAMIDPATIHIEAIISKRYLEDIVPGDQAEVLLLPSKRRITATVQDLRPLNEAPRGDAAQVTTGGFEQFRLILSLDNATARAVPVGQKVRLIVTGQEPGLFRRLLNLLYGLGKL